MLLVLLFTATQLCVQVGGSLIVDTLLIVGPSVSGVMCFALVL